MKMINRFLLLLACVAMALSLVSCFESDNGNDGGGMHQHTFPDVLTFDDTHHWYAATCEHSDLKLGFAEHEYVNGACVCGAVEPKAHEHTFPDAWTFDDTHHWHAATCEHSDLKLSFAEHEYVNGACVCGAVEPPPHVHEYKTDVTAPTCTAVGYTTYTCACGDKYIGDEIKKLEHDYQQVQGYPATCTEPGLTDGAKCSMCGFVLEEQKESPALGHSFDSNWSMSESMHWREATCSHSDLKFYEGSHFDNNKDGLCDVCRWNTLGSLGSIISATVKNAFKIKSGKVEYVVINRSVTEAWGGEPYSESMAWDDIEYILGTNGVYRKYTEDEYSDGAKTGNLAITEQWVALFEGENSVGVQATSSLNPETLLSIYVDAMPAAFGEGDLLGYFFAVPGLANAYGAEGILYELYSVATSDESAGVFPSNIEFSVDKATNTAAFSYNVYIVNESHISANDTMVYQVNYFEVEGKFTYTDDYAITSLELTVDSYTNEPGTISYWTYDADIDLTYDPDTKTMTLLPTAVPHTYSFKVTQEIGKREEIEIRGVDYFMPDNFGVYADEEGTTPITELEAMVGNRTLEVYVLSEGGFVAFLYDQMTVTVTDKDGNATNQLEAYLIGGAIQIYTHNPGEFIITVSSLDITCEVEVTVNDYELKGEFSFTATVSDSYTWSNKVNFVATNGRGYYIFYFPGTLGLLIEADGNPLYDPQAVIGDLEPYMYAGTIDHDGDGKPDGVNLRANEIFTFYITATAEGEYTIRYDFIPM